MKYLSPSIFAFLILLYHLNTYTMNIYHIPVYVVLNILFNYIEYLVHRYAFHHRTKAVPFVYDSHTRKHHVIFNDKNMEIKSNHDIQHVVMPLRSLFGLSLILLSAYIGLSFISLISAKIFIIAAISYALSYELTHLLYHTKFASNIGILRKLSKLHRIHHRTNVMRHSNFNVTLPLFDWIYGTLNRNDD